MSNGPESEGPTFGPPPPNPPPGFASQRPLRTAPARGASLLGCAFAFSFILNLVGGLVILLGCLGFLGLYKPDSTLRLGEKHYSGQSRATDKVAIITLDGVILETLLGYANKQIEHATDDQNVKAIVVRINSPGGSITASDDLYRKLIELRDGNPKKSHAPRPMIASMGGLAASGGYYVAMPGQTIFAEPTTLTGSIGVYISFPNVKKLADQYGVARNIIKQGQIKDSGSPFTEMSDHEQQVWQDMVNDAYQRFIQVVEKGRPMLSDGKLLEPLTITPVNAGPAFVKTEADKKNGPYKRYLADGGV